jgi:DNA-binding transcriptional LysR family regulator
MLFQDLKAFAAVVDCASLTKAAEKLRLTQSAVSRRIQSLEESLDAVLLDRTSRPPTPTPMGLRIYQGAVELLRDAEQLRRIPQEEATPHGKFRVGFTQVVADVVVLDAVNILKHSFPNLKMQVVTNWSSQLQQRLLEGELDAATLLLTSPSRLPQSLSGLRAGTFEILVVQSKRHPVVARSTDMQMLSRNEWILNPVGCGYRAALESAMGGLGETLKLGVDTHGAALQMRMIAAGLGLGLIPKRLLDESPIRNELMVVDVSDFALQMDIWVAYPSYSGNLKQANELLAHQVISGFKH